jgi:hypothetical protein
MKTTLIIMAAGLGSRYKGGIKQIMPAGPNGEIIMDYSIHDAMQAGFDRIVFVIRKDIEEDFKEAIGDRIEALAKEKGVEIGYAYQSLEDIPGQLPKGRTKPWGTGQAVLCAKDYLDTPYAVINADDYYGPQAFHLIHDSLAAGQDDLALAGFILKNTLSDNGGVTRGLCLLDEKGNVKAVKETKDIIKDGEGASAQGEVLDPDMNVSMNFWGFPVSFTAQLEQGFKDFFANPNTDLAKDEFLLPIFVDELLQKGEAVLKSLETSDSWFGITYSEDLPVVRQNFEALHKAGKYPTPLFADVEARK